MGERSGDEHAARVAAVLKRVDPTLELEAIAGPSLRRQGVTEIARAEDLAAVGLMESIGGLPRHLSLLRQLQRRFRAQRYQGIVLVDYPGFHLRVARAAAAEGIPVLYYIPPQMWAWGEWRIRRLRSCTSRVAVTLPFEREYYEQRGVQCSFVGHPLLDRKEHLSRAAARVQLGLAPNAVVLALFPGSRAPEVTRLWPRMRDAAKKLKDSRPNLKVVVAAMQGLDYPGAGDLQLVRERPESVMASSTAAICKSGTITLEAALADTPHVLTYAVHPVTAVVARRLSKVRHIGLVNLLADEMVVPEILQASSTPESLASAVAPLLEQKSTAAESQRAAFGLVRSRLGSPGAANRVAQLVQELAA